jgi:hypothetical protein
MSRRDQWRKVLDAEIERWSAMSCDQLLAGLRDPPRVYEVESGSKRMQSQMTF